MPCLGGTTARINGAARRYSVGTGAITRSRRQRCPLPGDRGRKLYYAHLFNRVGCDVATASKTILFGTVPRGFDQRRNASQCLVEPVCFHQQHQCPGRKWFITGRWGDGTTSRFLGMWNTATTVPGCYSKMVVSQYFTRLPGQCRVCCRVFQVPVADFAIKKRPALIYPYGPLTIPWIQWIPIHYLWDLNRSFYPANESKPDSIAHPNYPVFGSFGINAPSNT